MAYIHLGPYSYSNFGMISVNFGNKNDLETELISKTNAVASNLCFKSFPKLESYLYIASRYCFFKISFLVSPIKKVFKKCAVPRKLGRSCPKFGLLISPSNVFPSFASWQRYRWINSRNALKLLKSKRRRLRIKDYSVENLKWQTKGGDNDAKI